MHSNAPPKLCETSIRTMVWREEHREQTLWYIRRIQKQSESNNATSNRHGKQQMWETQDRMNGTQLIQQPYHFRGRRSIPDDGAKPNKVLGANVWSGMKWNQKLNQVYSWQVYGTQSVQDLLWHSDSMWLAACPPYLWGDVFILKVNQCIQVEQAQVWCGQRRPEIALEKWLATQTSKCRWSLDSDELCIFAWGVCIIQSANVCHSFDHTLLCFSFSRSIVSDTFSAHVHSVSATVEHSRTQFHVKGMTALHTTYTTQRFPTKWLSCLFLMPVIVCLDPKQRQR